MKKLVLVPLDERPCNYIFPAMLGDMTEYSIVRPPLDIMGKKKAIGNVDAIFSWFEDEIKDADGAIIAFDTLLYSGIIPSRLHRDSKEQCLARLEKIRALKKRMPKLTFYAFSLIMRNPSYSSADEEPDYYETYGRDIHLKGVIEHKRTLDIATKDELKTLQRINETLPQKHFDDYTQRRRINLALNKAIVSLVQEHIIDFLIIPQDDAHPYGLTAKDQEVIRDHIGACQVGLKVLMYPGADEVANTLLARMINQQRNYVPKVYLKYTSERAKHIIPLYEDRPLHETVKYQAMAVGAITVSSMAEADTVLIINAPPSKMLNASEASKRSIEYNAFRNLPEAVRYAQHVIDDLRKGVIIADVAYGNGGDLEFISMIKQAGLLFKVFAYAGWNTSSNTLGTAIPHGLLRGQYGESKAHFDFLGLRYTEDVGYCAKVRQDVIKDDLPSLGLNYFQADAIRGNVSTCVQKRLQDFVDKEINDASHRIVIKDCWMPWKRMFEVGLKVEVMHETS